MKKYLFLLVIIFIKCGYQQTEIWPSGEIPYCYASSFTSSEKAIIEYSMTSWERGGNVKFKQSECSATVVNIYRSNQNCSTLGYYETNARIELSQISLHTVEHELGHTIGLPHEHQRPDRDNFIVIHWDNIKQDKDQFQIFPDNYWPYDYTKYPYDYDSIMHYSNFAGSVNGGETIETPKPIWNYDITETDYAKVKDMYTADVYQD